MYCTISFNYLYWLLIISQCITILYSSIVHTCGDERKLWWCLLSVTWVHWGLVGHRGILQAFSPQLAASYFLCTRAWTKVQTDGQGVCLGCDDNGEAPIGCSIIKDDLVDMVVIHQWMILYQTGGDGLYLRTTRKYELLNTLGWELDRSFWHRFWLPKEDELSN